MCLALTESVNHFWAHFFSFLFIIFLGNFKTETCSLIDSASFRVLRRLICHWKVNCKCSVDSTNHFYLIFLGKEINSNNVLRLFCFDGTSGKICWETDITKKNVRKIYKAIKFKNKKGNHHRWELNSLKN